MVEHETHLPRVGVTAAWFDPENPRTWSGVPWGVIQELRRLGVYAGSRDATPWLSALAVDRLMRVAGRDSAVLGRGTRAVTTASNALSRLRTPRDVDGWVHLVGGYGPVVRGKYVTLFEMSPSQLIGLGATWLRSFGYPKANEKRMAWVAARQEAAYARAHACCVASRWAADSMIRDHGVDAGKIRVVGYGANVDIEPPADRDWSRPRFLFVGFDWERKNGDAVVRAFVRLHNDLPDARLDVVGFHPPIDVEGVMGHGAVSVSEPSGRQLLEGLFRAATCFVVPSFVEPFGIVYVEAAAAGVPSIATKIGGTDDSVGPGGILVDPHDDDEIHTAMRRMCDPDTARSLGDIALNRSKALTWQAVGQRVLRSFDFPPIEGLELANFL